MQNLALPLSYHSLEVTLPPNTLELEPRPTAA